MTSQPPNPQQPSSALRKIVSIGLFVILSVGVAFLSINFVLALIQRFSANGQPLFIQTIA